MIEIFEYLQHFQRQVEIFKKHVNTGISSFHNTGFAECLLCNAIVKAEQNTVIHAKVDDSELAKVNQCSADHIKAEKKLLEEHSKKLAKHLQNNEGIWLSSGWLRFTIVTLAICCITVILWALYK